MMTDKEIIDKQRQAFKEFMQLHKLKASPWAKKAGVAEATIRNYLHGRNQSLTSVNLEKLANAAGAQAQDLINSKNIAFEHLENIDSGYINKSLMVQSFIDIEEYTIQSGLKLSSKERANILIAWYELARMIQRDGLSPSSNLTLKDFIKNVASNA